MCTGLMVIRMNRLKELFQDEQFMKTHNICCVNSINWARIAVQSSYYVWSYVSLCQRGLIAQDDNAMVNYAIPTGAFGNAMGCYLAKLMGIPIRRIYCATNNNDIVHRTLSSGDMRMGENIQVYLLSVCFHTHLDCNGALFMNSDCTE